MNILLGHNIKQIFSPDISHEETLSAELMHQVHCALSYKYGTYTLFMNLALSSRLLICLLVSIDDFGSQLFYLWAFSCGVNVDTIDCCLKKGVHVAESIIIAYTEDKVHLKKFIKCCQRSGSMAGDELLVYHNKKIADGLLAGP